MPTFHDIATSAGIDFPPDFDFSPLSGIDITQLSSDVIESFFCELYDKKSVRGAKFSKHRDLVLMVLKHAKNSGIIDEIPKFELRTKTYKDQYNKPDENVLVQLLEQSKGMPIETIIRLSWECGLSRCEISNLKYGQIDFQAAEIVLEDRRVPLQSDVLSFLSGLMSENQSISDYVLITQKKTAPMAEQSISRLVRSELDAYGQGSVRLADLHFDYIVRLLESNRVEYVSYVSGVDIRTLQTQYLPHVSTVTVGEISSAPDYETFYRHMQSEKDSVCGLALWFGWQLGVKATELSNLTWGMLNLETGEFGDLQIPDELLLLLRGLQKKNRKFSEYIFISDKTKKPLTRERISCVVKQTLVQRGIFDIGIKELSRDYSPEMERSKRVLYQFLKKVVSADREQIAAELGVDVKSAGKLLNILRGKGDIVLVGREYYLQGTVVSPEEQHAAIVDYIEEHPLSTRKELCDMLGLSNRRQLLPVINPLLDDGTIIRTSDNRYHLAHDDRICALAMS